MYSVFRYFWQGYHQICGLIRYIRVWPTLHAHAHNYMNHAHTYMNGGIAAFKFPDPEP